MIKNKTPLALDQPRFIDATIDQILTKLTAELSWLGNTYGRVKRRRRNTDDRIRPQIVPVWPGDGEEEEIVLLPDDHLGNHCFFYMDDGYPIAEYDGYPPDMGGEGNVVFWYDIRDIYPDDWQTRNDMNVAYDIMQILRKATATGSVIIWTEVFVEPKNVYDGFSWDDVEEIHYMRPKGCVRISCTIKNRYVC